MEDQLARAILTAAAIEEHDGCPECFEEYLFHMKDPVHEFELGLRTVLACLYLAEEAGAVPPLPDDWWPHIMSRYR